MANLKKLKNRDDQNISEEGLVVHSEEAIWLDSKVTGNPAEIGLLLNIPTKSMEFYLQKKYRLAEAAIYKGMSTNRSIMCCMAAATRKSVIKRCNGAKEILYIRRPGSGIDTITMALRQ